MRPIPGFEGLYSVTDSGEIWSHDRTASNGRHIRGRWLKQQVNKAYGYREVRLSKDGQASTMGVHRLVALAFLGPCPPRHVVCHNNGQAGDNRASNLRYDTRSGNAADMVHHRTVLRGERHPSSKLKAVQVHDIRRRFDAGEGCDVLATEHGVSAMQVQAIGERRSWKWLQEVP